MSKLLTNKRPLYSEVDLGSIYDRDEENVILSYLQHCSNPLQGFSSNPQIIEEFEERFAGFVGTKHAIAMSNAGVCIDVLLRYASRTLNLRGETPLGLKGATQSINYKAVPMAMLRQNFSVDYIDVGLDYINPSPYEIRKSLENPPNVLFLTHMNGYPIDIHSALDRSKNSPNFIFEDCARSLGASVSGKQVGSLTDAGVHSFQSKKIITTLGEGGMITTNNNDIYNFAKSERQYGLESGLGSNFKITEIQAAVGLKQLDRLPQLLSSRRTVAASYIRAIKDRDLPLEPILPQGDISPVYYVMPTLLTCESPDEKRTQIFKVMRERFNVNLSISNPRQTNRWQILGENIGIHSSFFNSAELEKKMISLPVHPLMSSNDVDMICDALSVAISI